MLLRLRGDHVRHAVVLHQEVCGQGQPAGRGADHVAEIAENVVIGLGGDGRIELHLIPGHQIGSAGWMNAQLKDHGRRLRAVIGDLVACTYLHRKPLWPAPAELCRMIAKSKTAKSLSLLSHATESGAAAIVEAGVILSCRRAPASSA